MRGEHCFVCLNAFPYTSGHVMVMPYAHLDRLAALPTNTAHELMDLAQRTEKVLQTLYNPHGFNIGMNFMTTVGESRILPEDLKTTWLRMREAFTKPG